MPMRFADLDGTMIDAYQATTQMTDESGQSYPFTANALLDRAIGSEGYYGAYVANMHTDSVSSAGSDAIVSSAQARGVPVVSSRQMLEWVDGRNGSSFAGLSWSGNTLEFSIDVGAGANGLRAMVPTSSAAGALTGVTRNGSPIATTPQTIKGVEYAFIDAAPGAYEATYDVDQTGPAISNVAHTAGAGTATITWDTNEAADSRVDYGTSPSSLTSSESNPALGTSHSIELTGLDPNTTYHYRVTSADVASNSTTDPAGAQAPRSFTTPAANLTDTTVADFSAGTTGADGYVSQTADGELMLRPAVGEEFSGALVLPTGWSGTSWESQGGGAGGTATVSGGSLRVNGAFASTDATFGAGRSLEASATFGGAPFQHLGFSDDFNSVWAIFSTGNTSNQLFARTNTGSGRDRYADPRLADRLRAPLPGRVGRQRGPLLRRRQPGRHARGQLWHRDEPGGQRLQRGRSGALGQLVADEPVPGLHELRLAHLRRRSAGQLAGADLDGRYSGQHRRGAQRPHRRHADARRKLDRLRAGRELRRLDRRQLALPAVPRRAQLERRAAVVRA